MFLILLGLDGWHAHEHCTGLAGGYTHSRVISGLFKHLLDSEQLDMKVDLPALVPKRSITS